MPKKPEIGDGEWKTIESYLDNLKIKDAVQNFIAKNTEDLSPKNRPRKAWLVLVFLGKLEELNHLFRDCLFADAFYKTVTEFEKFINQYDVNAPYFGGWTESSFPVQNLPKLWKESESLPELLKTISQQILTPNIVNFPTLLIREDWARRLLLLKNNVLLKSVDIPNLPRLSVDDAINTIEIELTKRGNRKKIFDSGRYPNLVKLVQLSNHPILGIIAQKILNKVDGYTSPSNTELPNLEEKTKLLIEQISKHSFLEKLEPLTALLTKRLSEIDGIHGITLLYNFIYALTFNNFFDLHDYFTYYRNGRISSSASSSTSPSAGIKPRPPKIETVLFLAEKFFNQVGYSEKLTPELASTLDNQAEEILKFAKHLDIRMIKAGDILKLDFPTAFTTIQEAIRAKNLERESAMEEYRKLRQIFEDITISEKGELPEKNFDNSPLGEFPLALKTRRDFIWSVLARIEGNPLSHQAEEITTTDLSAKWAAIEQNIKILREQIIVIERKLDQLSKSIEDHIKQPYGNDQELKRLLEPLKAALNAPKIDISLNEANQRLADIEYKEKTLEEDVAKIIRLQENLRELKENLGPQIAKAKEALGEMERLKEQLPKDFELQTHQTVIERAEQFLSREYPSAEISETLLTQEQSSLESLQKFISLNTKYQLANQNKQSLENLVMQINEKASAIRTLSQSKEYKTIAIFWRENIEQPLLSIERWNQEQAENLKLPLSLDPSPSHPELIDQGIKHLEQLDSMRKILINYLISQIRRCEKFFRSFDNPTELEAFCKQDTDINQHFLQIETEFRNRLRRFLKDPQFWTNPRLIDDEDQKTATRQTSGSQTVEQLEPGKLLLDMLEVADDLNITFDKWTAGLVEKTISCSSERWYIEFGRLVNDYNRSYATTVTAFKEQLMANLATETVIKQAMTFYDFLIKVDPSKANELLEEAGKNPSSFLSKIVKPKVPTGKFFDKPSGRESSSASSATASTETPSSSSSRSSSTPAATATKDPKGQNCLVM